MTLKSTTEEEMIASLLESLQHRGEGFAPGQYMVRCRIPFQMNCPGTRTLAQRGAIARAEDGEEVANEEDEAEGRITGPASSTSVDWYRTRMGLDALKSMEEQFKNGIDYFPRHHGFLSSVEWYEVIGRTVGAELKKESVKNPSEVTSAGEQYVLYVDTALDMDEENAQKLLRRVRKGAGPGQSVGGWIRGISVTYDDDDEIIDMEIVDIELDHLAAVRSPANPDADRLWETFSQQLSEMYALSREAPAEPSAESVPAAPSSDPEPPGLHQRSEAQGAPAEPPTPSDPAPRCTDNNQEIDMDPKQLAEAIARAVAEANAPVLERLDAIAARSAPPEIEDSADPTPPPPPVIEALDPNVVALRQQLAASEAARVAAEARAAASEQIRMADPSQRSARQRQEQTPGEAPEARASDRRNPTYHGLDLREVAPKAVRAVARSYGELDMTPALVAQLDGPGALAQLAAVDGSGRNIARFIATEPDLLSRKALLKRTRGDLEDMLGDILWEGMQDGLIRKKTNTPNTASWV